MQLFLPIIEHMSSSTQLRQLRQVKQSRKAKERYHASLSRADKMWSANKGLAIHLYVFARQACPIIQMFLPHSIELASLVLDYLILHYNYATSIDEYFSHGCPFYPCYGGQLLIRYDKTDARASPAVFQKTYYCNLCGMMAPRIRIIQRIYIDQLMKQTTALIYPNKTIVFKEEARGKSA